MWRLAVRVFSDLHGSLFHRKGDFTFTTRKVTGCKLVLPALKRENNLETLPKTRQAVFHELQMTFFIES